MSASASPTPILYKGAANFKLYSKMGEGAVGEVFHVAHKRTCEIFALKRVNKIQAEMVSNLKMKDIASNHMIRYDDVYSKPTHLIKCWPFHILFP